MAVLFVHFVFLEEKKVYLFIMYLLPCTYFFTRSPATTTKTIMYKALTVCAAKCGLFQVYFVVSK